jgi:A/G-specific adenine glycosylase
MEVLMVRRSQSARLMAGMWELPELSPPRDQRLPVLTLRHSITVTDYTVQVWEQALPISVSGKWIASSRLPELPMTGLARKILRKTQTLKAHLSSKESSSPKVLLGASALRM